MNDNPRDDYRWWDISGFMPELEILAKCRDEQKASYSSTKNWSRDNSTHFIGLCAEFCVFLETGMRMDLELRPGGDRGYDFERGGTTYDAKGAAFWASPDLKEFPNRKKFADKYILVAVKKYREVRVAGWATRGQLAVAKLKNYGNGDMLSLPYPSLAAMGQTGLPPELPRRTASESAAMEAKLVSRLAARLARDAA